MGLKDFFIKRRLKKQKANGLKNATAYLGNKNDVKPQLATGISDEELCSLWTKCQSCKELLYTSELKKNYSVCKSCDFHHRLTAEERIEHLVDYGTFIQVNENLKSSDPLQFIDLKPYKDRLKEAEKSTKTSEAIITGLGNINGTLTAIASMEFRFIGGSMGCVVGEKLTRLIELALEKKLSLVIVSSSGGARMHEGILSLMQMAKTAAALKKLHEAKLLYISVLTEPTFGGVTASFSMLGDIAIAEPKARIGFAGRRVIEETIRQKLPKDFQTAEYLLEHGHIDLITHRSKLKATISDLINLHKPQKAVNKEKSKDAVKDSSLVTV